MLKPGFNSGSCCGDEKSRSADSPTWADPYEKLRNEMVEAQLVSRGIKDPRVLAAMRKVPRHCFVPQDRRGSAYHDAPLPIGLSQTISQPLMVAMMTECLALKGDEKVLEVGTGSGYQAAVLAELCRLVVSVERHEQLQESARKRLSGLGYSNIVTVVGDGTFGHLQDGPFDGIIVTAGGPKIPASLVEQLKEGGRLVMPVGGRHEQTLIRGVMRMGALAEERVTGCAFVPLVGSEGWEER